MEQTTKPNHHSDGGPSLILNMDNRKDAVWFETGPVASKRNNEYSYEIWANGTFATTAPNGDRWKDRSGNASGRIQWLEERGIKDDEALGKIMNNEDGWDTCYTRWFELIVFQEVRRTPDQEPVMVEISCGDISHEYNKEDFEIWLDSAIADE